MAAGSPVAARQQAILNMQRTKGNAAVQRMLSSSHQRGQIQRQPTPQPQPPANQPTQSGKIPTSDEVMSAIQSVDFSLPGDLQVNLHLADALVSYPGTKQG